MRPRGCCPERAITFLKTKARLLFAALEAVDPEGIDEDDEVIEARAVVQLVPNFHPLQNGLLLALELPLPSRTVDENRAKVLSIGDGDTIRVLQGQQRLTIRLACNRCAEA